MNEPRPANALIAAPAHLTPSQLKLWDEALAEAPPGLLTSIDASVLEAYCVWRDTFSAAAAEMMRRGSVTMDLKGERRVAPEVVVMDKATKAMLKACADMGFNPSSRSRINLEAPQNAGNEFGDV